MAPARSRPFSISFGNGSPPAGGTPGGPGALPKGVPVNSFVPVDVENEHFVGKILIIHETGNEPGVEEEAWDEQGDARSLRGVEFQLQGRFKRAGGGALWVCGELADPLKLGWVAHGVVVMLMKFVKKMSGGQAYYCLGNQDERPHLAFPAGLVFTILATPSGQAPPALGSPEVGRLKWQGPAPIKIETECTYTFVYKTPWVDFCTWELLKVPGISPLPFETVIGEVKELRMLFYDFAAAGSHGHCRQGAQLEVVLNRGGPGDTWLEEMSEGDRTPLEDPSEASDVEEADGFVDEEDQGSGSSDDSGEPIGEHEGAASEAESLMDLSENDAWRPRPEVMLQIDEGAHVKVPWYIEAVDRRRRKRVRAWFILAMKSEAKAGEWYHAQAVHELAALLRPRPRMTVFRRGKARGCCAATTLEQVRHAFLAQAAEEAPCGPESKIRSTLLSSIAAAARPPQQAACWSPLKKKAPLVPPRFFVSGGSRACELAFAGAKEGRDSTVREGLVGAVHFEGRLCEEWLRLSEDGCLRCFTPYNCDTPRLVLRKGQIWRVGRLEAPLLRRFYLWEAHSEHRVFVFCCADQAERDAWIVALEPSKTGRAEATPRLLLLPSRARVECPMSGDAAKQLADTTRARRWRPKARLVLNDRQLLLSAAPVQVPRSHELLGLALRLPAKPSSEDAISFVNATCLLKAVQFIDWTQNDCLGFWLNIYHCLLIHGCLLLGTPKSKRELVRFNSRVSYLVGMIPVSLREIENFILCSPTVDSEAVSSSRRAQAKQLLAARFKCLWRGSRPYFFHPVPARRSSCGGAAAPAKEEGGGGGGGAQKPRGAATCPVGRWCGLCKVIPCTPQCLPMLPLAPSWWQRQASAVCLHLGHAAAGYGLPQADARVAFCLNRGNLSYPPAIPVFHSECLNEQLDEVSQKFISEFVQVQDLAGMLTRVTLPPCCRGVKRVLGLDQQALLRFVWQYMAPERGLALPHLTRPQVRFQKYRREPRARSELVRLAYSRPELEAPAAALPKLDLGGGSPSEGQLLSSPTKSGGQSGRSGRRRRQPCEAKGAAEPPAKQSPSALESAEPPAPRLVLVSL